MKAIRFTEEQLAAHQKKWTRPPVVLVAKPRKPAKYRNVKTVKHGIKFDSKHEAQCYSDLLLRQAAGSIRYLQRQVSFPLTVDGKKVQTYRCDFWYFDCRFTPPKLVIADAKSAHTAGLNAWKRTKALFEALYGMEIEIL